MLLDDVGVHIDGAVTRLNVGSIVGLRESVGGAMLSFP